MIRLPVAERRFALALIVSAAIHAALLPMLLSFASGSAPRHVQPIRESSINAFLVPGHLAASGKIVAMPGRKRRAADRAAPVAAALPREVPENVAPAEKEGKKLLADIRPPAKWLGMGHDSGALPAPASPAPPALVPGGGDLSGSNGAGSTAARRGGGEISGGDGAGAHASWRKGTGESPLEGSGVGPPKDADAVPRYGDNVRPAYPPLARLRGYQGVVVLFVEVLVDGRVGQVGIRRSAGHEILDRAALEAVRTWRFEPGRKERRAVTMSVEVPVRFVLNGNSAW
ncbi:MAG: energy transducer TonB [Syntrophaceae bacterium]|nr:energy transducer TonB [Pseudomonadota bacterium]MCG2741867.1 energy transducer TonB [Syntrophaceae bacterium]